MIMRPGQRLLMPVNPAFLWASLLLAFAANMLGNMLLWGRAAWAPDVLSIVLVFWTVHQTMRVGVAAAFVFGLLVLMLLYAKLRWFPPGRVTDWVSAEISSGQFKIITNIMTVDALINGRFDVFLDSLRHLVLPVITLSYIRDRKSTRLNSSH